MALQNTLSDLLTKERGGRHGGKGHEFHRYWALCHLLKLDLQNQDFLMLVEFIEDVAVLDNELTPTAIELFQLKKKEGSANWTKSSLLKRSPPATGKSILAKLHESRIVARNETKTITFISNAPIDIALSDTSDSKSLSEIKGSDIESGVSGLLRQSVARELGCGESEIDFSDFVFARSPLAMDDLEVHATGHVASYLAQKYPENSARADVLCKALYSEIRVKATSTEDAAGFNDLKRIRGISRSQLLGMVSVTLAKKPDTEVVNAILTTLAQEQIPFVKREAIKQAARRFLVDKAGKGVVVLVDLQHAIDSNYTAIPGTLITSWEVATWIVQKLRDQIDANIIGALDDNYLLAVVLFRMHQ